MSKSDEYREMQISSGQLAAVIFSLLALCVLVFYLGIRVGTKKAVETAAAAVLKTQSEKIPVEKPLPTEVNPAATEAKPAEQKIPPAGVASAKPQGGETPAATKLPAVEVKPQAAETKAPPKVEPKPNAAETKVPAPAESKTKQAPADETGPAPSGTFYIQVGALDTRPKAENVALKIEGMGYRAIVLNPFAGDKKTVYRVRVGPYETKKAAESDQTKLAAALKKKMTDFFIVKG